MSDESEIEAGLAPRANPNLYGHEAGEAALLEAFAGGRLPHAWLITGPRGIGKATLAYRFARFVLAQEKPGGSSEPGGLFGAPAAPKSLALKPDHPVFRRTAAGGHADLLTVERGIDEKTGRKRTEIVVEDARAVADFLHLTPAEGGWRVVVIDGVEDMNRSAANAVLKIVEEPPAQALILLVSHAPGRLLATIRSRCRRLALKPLDEATIRRILGEQIPGLDPGDATALARLAEGSAGRALELAAQGGLDLLREVMGLLETLPRLDGVALHRLAERMGGADGAERFRTVTELVQWWLARLIRVGGTGEGPAGGEVVPGESALYARLSAARRLDPWLEVWDKTGALFSRAESVNLERKQVVLNAFLALEAAARG
ncbi:MAG TPA: DNA polymerase III subunit delta' [Alphaproteobacteria bacterium]|nr:DNA polymerase III subunit delta' [Alphaproteobacteria bacterium]